MNKIHKNISKNFKILSKMNKLSIPTMNKGTLINIFSIIQ